MQKAIKRKDLIKEYAWEDLIKNCGSSVISILHAVQEKYNYLPEKVMREVAHKTETPLIEIYRIATFYKYFSLAPKGKHKILTCSGTACHVRNSESVTQEISRLLDVEPDSTKEDGSYSLERVNCLGACALAPLIVIDDEYYGNMTPSKIQEVLCKHQEENEQFCDCHKSA